MVKEDTKSTPKSTIARTDDGTIQITFTIPFDLIKQKREEAAKLLSESASVPGFRKGKAPLDKVMETLPQNTLLEKTLSLILPNLLSDAIKDYKIEPIIYPKFELVKAEEGTNWQIRAVTCEAPLVDLSNYKSILQGNLRAKSIWTPGSTKPKTSDKVQEPTREQKEQEILKNLLESVKIKIPKILITEEADNRLSNLLARIEKLGLSLESYLSSVGKNAQTLRLEYEKQAIEGLALDFILSKIAEEENISVEKSEIDASIQAAVQGNGQAENYDTPERRNFIEMILKRRKALDYLLKLY